MSRASRPRSVSPPKRVRFARSKLVPPASAPGYGEVWPCSACGAGAGRAPMPKPILTSTKRGDIHLCLHNLNQLLYCPTERRDPGAELELTDAITIAGRPSYQRR